MILCKNDGAEKSIRDLCRHLCRKNMRDKVYYFFSLASLKSFLNTFFQNKRDIPEMLLFYHQNDNNINCIQVSLHKKNRHKLNWNYTHITNDTDDNSPVWLRTRFCKKKSLLAK